VAADEDDDGQVANQARPQQPPLADQARAQLKATCAENGWDLTKVAGLYDGDLRAETDAAKIVAFTKSLHARSDDDLKAAS
jgi:hypothetical protein